MTFSLYFKSSYRLAAVLAVLVTLVGCVSTGGSARTASQQADPRLTNSQEARFFSRSGLDACVTTGAVVALVCAISGNCDKGGKALAAAAVGCGVGMGANYYLDTKRARHASRQAQLNAVIADVYKENQRLESLIATSQEVLAEDKATLTRIRQDIRGATADKALAKRQLSEVDANADYLAALLAKLKKREQEWQRVAEAEQGGTQSQLQTLNEEIGKLQRNIRILESELDEMLTMRAGIQVV